MWGDTGSAVVGKPVCLPGIASEVALAADWALQVVRLYVQKTRVLSEMKKSIACRMDEVERDPGCAPAVEREKRMCFSMQCCLYNGAGF